MDQDDKFAIGYVIVLAIIVFSIVFWVIGFYEQDEYTGCNRPPYDEPTPSCSFEKEGCEND